MDCICLEAIKQNSKLLMLQFNQPVCGCCVYSLFLQHPGGKKSLPVGLKALNSALDVTEPVKI